MDASGVLKMKEKKVLRKAHLIIFEDGSKTYIHQKQITPSRLRDVISCIKENGHEPERCDACAYDLYCWWLQLHIKKGE